MKLFLTSSGIPFSEKDKFLSVFSKPVNEIKMYFIPTAADVEPDGQQWVTKSENQFSEIGINPIWYNIAYKTKEQITTELSDADCIWVNGGNTFYLLDVAKKSGFLEVAKDLVINKNVVYGGTSAGTILACKTISSAGWKLQGDSNDVGIEDLSSLGFVDFTCFVHYIKEKHSVGILENKENRKVFALTDESFLVVKDSTVEEVGKIDMYE